MAYFIAWQEMRDSEWSVTRYFTPLIGGEPLVEGVKINIFAYYERMHRPILLKYLITRK